jgi:putative pyruvate formate lyase activating enzyme
VDRLAGKVGKCHVGAEIIVGSAGIHFGEEDCLVGPAGDPSAATPARRGAGSVFFSGCNLACAFCQSHAISLDVLTPVSQRMAAGLPLVRGRAVSAETLSGWLLRFQAEGAATVNLISPTHYAPQVVEVLERARSRGLTLPVVFNCGGYEALPMLRLLEGLVDVYLPDVKTFDPAVAERVIGAADYPERVREAVAEMHRQVGDLDIGPDGIARRGLLVRHLVMPDGAGTTPAVLEFLRSLSPRTAVNIMGQYRPAHRAFGLPGFPGLARRPSEAEVSAALGLARSLGLRTVSGG